MELSEFAKRLLALAEDLAGAPVRVDVSYTVTAASGTLVEAVAESPELALALWLVDVLEERSQTTDDGRRTADELRPETVQVTIQVKEGVGRPLQESLAEFLGQPLMLGGNGDGTKEKGSIHPTGNRPTTPEHLERMRGMTGRRNAEIAEELGLPISTVAYHMGKMRKGQKGRGEEEQRSSEGSPFREGGGDRSG